MTQPSEHKVVMAKAVASRWLSVHTHPEYHLRVYWGARDIRGVPSLLHSFRDGKLKIGSVEPIRDLGIFEDMDGVRIWTANREGLIQLKDWFEARGCETTGIW